jgi:hypothetical protein
MIFLMRGDRLRFCLGNIKYIAMKRNDEGFSLGAGRFHYRSAHTLDHVGVKDAHVGHVSERFVQFEAEQVPALQVEGAFVGHAQTKKGITVSISTNGNFLPDFTGGCAKRLRAVDFRRESLALLLSAKVQENTLRATPVLLGETAGHMNDLLHAGGLPIRAGVELNGGFGMMIAFVYFLNPFFNTNF